jgi:catalase
VAFICTDGVNEEALNSMKKALEDKGAMAKIIAPHLGTIKTDKGTEIPVDQSLLIAASVLFDSVYIPANGQFDFKDNTPDVIEFINESYKHCKVIGFGENIKDFIKETMIPLDDKKNKDNGIIISKNDNSNAQEYISALAQHRFWEREPKA